MTGTLLFNDQCPSHIETSQLICRANQLTGFYMTGTLVVKRLNVPMTKQNKVVLLTLCIVNILETLFAKLWQYFDLQKKIKRKKGIAMILIFYFKKYFLIPEAIKLAISFNILVASIYYEKQSVLYCIA